MERYISIFSTIENSIQALEQLERYPERGHLYLGPILFGPEPYKLRACKTCIRLARHGLSASRFTAEEIENMTELCPTHLDEQLSEERAKAKAALEAKLAKQLKQMQAKHRKEIKEAEMAKTIRSTKKTKVGKNGKIAKVDKKTAKTVKEKQVLDLPQPKIEINDEDIDQYILEQAAPKKKNVTRWICPTCDKSSKFGSCGCVGCGDWYHITCVGFKKAKEVPDKWACKYCK